MHYPYAGDTGFDAHWIIPPACRAERVLAEQIVYEVARPAYDLGRDPAEFVYRIWGFDRDSVAEVARDIVARATELARETGGRVCWGGDCGIDKHWVLAQCFLEDDIAAHACDECGAYTPGPEAHPGGICPECAAEGDAGAAHGGV